MSRNELQIECTGLALEPLEPVVAEAGFIMLPPLVDLVWATCEHAGDQRGEGVSQRGDGVGRTESCPEASRVGAQGALTVQPVVRGEA